MTQLQGWTPDKDDPRDFTLDKPEIQNLLFKSQATERLAKILAHITEVLYQTKVPFTKRTLLNKELLDNVNTEVKEIEALNSAASKTLLSLVPASLSAIDTEKGEACTPPIGTRLKMPPEAELETKRLYVPILGNPQDWQNKKFALPRKITLEYKTRIEDQGNLLSCSAHAAVALMEYFELQRDRNATQDHQSAPSQDAALEDTQTPQKTTFSSRFLYKVTRTIYHQTLLKEGQSIEKPDTGAPLRDTLKAMLLFGVPPEDYWGWSLQRELDFDNDPPPFCYAYAKNYQAAKYFRLDRPGIDPDTLLAQIKTALVAKFPVIFGFRIFEDDLRQAKIAKTGMIPFPPTGYLNAPAAKDSQGNVMIRGHAVMAVGYDDDKDTGNGGKGALYFKNCWGEHWGDQGYGWLPYEYVLKATADNYLTRDWWTLIDANWADTEQLVGTTFDTEKPVPVEQEFEQVWVVGDPSIFGAAVGRRP